MRFPAGMTDVGLFILYCAIGVLKSGLQFSRWRCGSLCLCVSVAIGCYNPSPLQKSNSDGINDRAAPGRGRPDSAFGRGSVRIRTPKVYIETSVFNATLADDAPGMQQDALALFEVIDNDD